MRCGAVRYCHADGINSIEVLYNVYPKIGPLKIPLKPGFWPVIICTICIAPSIKKILQPESSIGVSIFILKIFLKNGLVHGSKKDAFFNNSLLLN